MLYEFAPSKEITAQTIEAPDFKKLYAPTQQYVLSNSMQGQDWSGMAGLVRVSLSTTLSRGLPNHVGQTHTITTTKEIVEYPPAEELAKEFPVMGSQSKKITRNRKYCDTYPTKYDNLTGYLVASCI
jgi:hypothetical protein